MTQCVAYRCQAKGGRDHLCPRHRKRLRAGQGLPTANEKLPGDPSGHGLYGVIDRDPDLGMLCHDCGARVRGIARHARKAHRLTDREYRAEHGLRSRDTIGPLSMPVGWVPLTTCPCGATHRHRRKLCDNCLAARGKPKPARRGRWRNLTDDEVDALRHAEGSALAELVAGLQLDRAMSKEIGAVIGLAPFQMVRRFPRPDWRSHRPTASRDATAHGPD